MDANLLHISYEGGRPENPWKEPEAGMWRWTVLPERAPHRATDHALTYRRRDLVAINGKPMSPATILAALNKLGSANGIGRFDIVENRYVGMKSRGAYGTPGRHHHAQRAPRQSDRSRSTAGART